MLNMNVSSILSTYFFNPVCSAPSFLRCEKTAKIAAGTVLTLGSLNSLRKAKSLKTKAIFVAFSAIGIGLELSDVLKGLPLFQNNPESFSADKDTSDYNPFEG
ncbi:MAG: hypothetical protein K1060chlam5_00683 [Candidatus Anoxychlamydiales bacterium]|nr:hypothetical protein [Candidatus Anoxychlamydiales bacterium]